MDLSNMRIVDGMNIEFYTERDEYPLFLPDEVKPVRHFARVTYTGEDDEGVWKITFPKIEFPFLKRTAPAIKLNTTSLRGTVAAPKIDLGFGYLPMDADNDGRYVIADLIESKVRKMTISEIEKQLGYKIELVEEDSK